MNLSRLGVVFRKELLDGIRDRRSITSVIVSALIGPLLVTFLFSRIAERQRNADEVSIPIVGAQYAPAFVDWLKQQSGVEVLPGPPDPEQAVRDRKMFVVLVIDKEFTGKFSRSIPAPIKMISDATRDEARPRVRRVRALMQRYSSEIAMLRLISHGVSPAVANPLKLDDVEVSSAQQRAAVILGFIPMFVIMAAFVGGLQLATDSTAGERERSSLEPLLLNPVPRGSLVGGKWLAASLFAVAGVIFSCTLCILAVQRVPLHEMGARFRIGVPELLLLLAVSIPMAFLASALQMSIATFARSYKEAQSYLGMLMLLPTIPGALAPIYPMTGQPWLAPVPILGQYSLVSDVLGGKTPSPLLFAVAAVSTIGVALLLVTFTTRLFHRERIVFGR